MNILNTLFYLVSVIPFIALPFLFVNWARYMKAQAENKSRRVPVPAKVPLKSVLFFAVPIIVAITIAEFVAARSRMEALTFLSNVSGNYRVYVNAQAAKNPGAIIAALKTTGSRMAHHSSPTRMIRVDIQSDRGDLSLQLGRDSSYAQEYWVFYPKYRITSNNEIGKVVTAAFDEY
jgi:hypothetical protein